MSPALGNELLDVRGDGARRARSAEIRNWSRSLLRHPSSS